MFSKKGDPASPDENTKDKLDMLPALKGAPVSILYALHFSQRPMSNHLLMRTVHYSDKTVSCALETLKEKGLIRRIAGGWVLAFDFFGVGIIPSQESELFRPYGNSPSTTTDINTEEELTKEVAVDATSRKNSVLTTLHKVGIYDPTAVVLAQLDHVTEEFVKAHADYGKKKREGIGLVITRIQNGEPVPVEESASQEELRGEAVDEKVNSFLKH